MAGDNIAAAIDALRSDLIVRIEQQESTSRAQQPMIWALIGILATAVFGILASMFPGP